MARVLITNLKSKDNLQKAVFRANPKEIIIISNRKAKYSDFDVKTRYLKVKNQFEDVIHKINEVLKSSEDIIIIVKPDSIGTYILWLANIYALNPAFIISHGEIQQVPLLGKGEVSEVEGDILKLADCHGFIDPLSINKEFGILEDDAKMYLENFSKMGILKFIKTKDFEVGDLKDHPYYNTDLLERGKDIENLYMVTELGRMVLYVILTEK
ncbi:hypothetical protein [Methanobacterium sp. ACI-7]|uniref:hypothetical protein n=1 Tax=unclassified Methanobacterium TaxID=2627676 RepID=UPI0039C3C719